jgi:hypothetical protein
MVKIKPYRLLLIPIGLALLAGTVLVMQAAPPRSVGLLSFEVTALTNAIHLDWETATELQTAGFIVKRSVNSGAFISLPDIGVPGFIDAEGNPAGLVIAIGGPAEGGIYQEMDSDVEAGNHYTYKLIEVESDFNEVELDNQSVIFGSTPTNTPTTQPLVTPASDPPTTATPTLLPGSTVLSTATSTPAAVATQPANNGTANVPTQLPAVLSAAQPEVISASGQSGNEGVANAEANNTVLAQVEVTAVPPTSPEATINSDNGYPGSLAPSEPTEEPDLPTPTPLDPAATAYPLATEPTGQDEGAPAVPIIGGQGNSQPDDNAANSSQELSGRDQRLGKIYLWSGFLLSLLIFITTVVATILLFTRKRTQ